MERVSLRGSILSALYLVRGDVSSKLVFVVQHISGSFHNVTPRREGARDLPLLDVTRAEEGDKNIVLFISSSYGVCGVGWGS